MIKCLPIKSQVIPMEHGCSLSLVLLVLHKLTAGKRVPRQNEDAEQCILRMPRMFAGSCNENML